jgi:hypothetical protein
VQSDWFSEESGLQMVREKISINYLSKVFGESVHLIREERIIPKQAKIAPSNKVPEIIL